MGLNPGITRVGTKDNYNRANYNFQKIQVDITKINNQLSSGKLYGNFIEQGVASVGFLSVKTDLANNDIFIRNAKNAIDKQKEADKTIELVQNIARELDNQIISIKNTNNNKTFDLASYAKSKLEELSFYLNKEYQGASLFAGSKVDQNAVGDLTTSSNVIGRQVTNNYYKGDSYIETVQASEFLNIETGVTADHPAFQNIIGALHTAISYYNSGAEADFDLVRNFTATSQSELSKIRASYTLQTKQFEDAKGDLTELNIILRKFASENSDTDIAEASVELTEKQAQLEAIFQAFGVLKNLNLSDYI